MTHFTARMAACRRTKQAARNRGESFGNFRGQLRPRPMPEQPEWWLEREFAEIARELAWQQQDEAAQLAHIIAYTNDATMADLAAPF